MQQNMTRMILTGLCLACCLAAMSQEKSTETTLNLLPNSGFNERSAHPRLPDYWGMWGNIAMEAKAWTLDNYGVDEKAESPVSGAKVVALRFPAAADLLEPGKIPFFGLLHTGVPGRSPGDYTLSVYAKSDKAGTILMFGTPSRGDKKFELGTTWKRYTSTCKEAPDLGFILPTPGATVWLAAPQLDPGSAATEYKPSRGAGGANQNSDIVKVELPTVAPPVTDTAPVIDGKLDEPCWAKAAKIESTHLLGGAAGKTPTRTESLVLRDGKALYIGIKCAEPEMDKMRAKALRNDNGEVFADDAIELFISLKESAEPYFQFGVNSIGTTYEAKGAYTDWNCDWSVKTSKGQGEWHVEIAIPFSSLPLAGADGTWRFNISRDRQPGGCEWNSWAPVVNGFHDKARFGKLLGIDVKNLGAYQWLVDGLVLAKRPDGLFKLSGRFPNRPADVKSARITVEVVNATAAGAVPKKFNLQGNKAAFEFDGLRLDPDMPLYKLVLKIDEPASGKNIFSLPVDVEPSDCDLLWGGKPLQAFMEYDFITDDPELRGKIVWSGLGKAAVSARILSLSDGRVAVPDAVKADFDRAGERTFAVDMSKLPPGGYELVASAAAADGKAIEAVKDRFAKLPKNPVEVRLSRFTRVMLVNGKPFFPTFLPQSPDHLTDAHIERLKAAGFNCLAAGLGKWTFKQVLEKGALLPDTAAAMRVQLDRLEKHGMKFLWPTLWSCGDYGKGKELFNGDVAKFTKAFNIIVDAFKDHPAVIGWYIMDEPCEGDWTGLKEPDRKVWRDAVRKADPYRPAYVNWNHDWQTEPYGGIDCTDIVSDDSYQISGARFSDMRELVDNARMINDRRAGRKPGFEWISGSYGPPETSSLPRPRDVRVHAWLHLVYGTRGMGYWSGVPFNPEVWDVMSQFNHEAVALGAGLLGARNARPAIAATQNNGIHYSLWIDGSQAVVMALNISDKPVRFQLDPSASTGRRALAVKRMFDTGRIKLKNGALSEEIPPCQRMVYQLELKP